MAEYYEKHKFPCGYEYTIYAKELMGESDAEPSLDKCPLHGKDCKSGGKR